MNLQIDFARQQGRDALAGLLSHAPVIGPFAGCDCACGQCDVWRTQARSAAAVLRLLAGSPVPTEEQQ